MLRAAFRILVPVLLGVVAVSVRADAADVTVGAPAHRTVVVRTAPPATVIAAPPGEVVVEATPLQPPPRVEFGCKRIWRCDAQVCEWRRGCWGIYGYVEGPYYTLSLARRQWERDGWPTPDRRRY